MTFWMFIDHHTTFVFLLVFLLFLLLSDIFGK
jgi:hypothetical protein